MRLLLVSAAVACSAVAPVVLAGQGAGAPFVTAPGSPLAPPGAPNVSVSLRLPLAGVETIEVLRLGRSAAERRWQIADVARYRIADRGAFTMQAPAGLDTLLVFRPPGADAYVLDGPFHWPHRPAAYTVPVSWRRTVRGGWPRRGAAAPVWVDADLHGAPAQPWPLCTWSGDARWECVGVPIDAAGVVVSTTHNQLAYALALPGRAAGGIEEALAEAAAWGRLLVAARTGNPGDALPEVTVSARRIEVPRARPQAVRVLTVADRAVRAERLSAASFWLTGGETHPDTWVEVTARGLAPARVTLTEVAGSPPEFPLRIDLDPAVAVFGRTTAGAGMPASAAVVSLFRLVPDRVRPEKQPPRRLLVAEQTTNEDGVFRFDDLAMDRYELLAMHPTLGRAERLIEPDGQELEVALKRPVEAIGRVLRGGTPAGGVTVRVMPGLAQFAAAVDVTELTGGEAQTDADGRFAVALSPRGGGELRIGGDKDAVRRVSLPAADPRLRMVDVGDVDIGEVPAVTLVLEGSEGCELLMAGPQGRAGLTVVRATRVGPAMFHATLPEPGGWMVVASCGGRERVVLPASIDVKSGTNAVPFRLFWPRGNLDRRSR